MPTETLRPNADIANTGTLVSAATVTEAWSDDSDTSYLTLATSGQDALVNVDSFALPSGARTKHAKIRLRCADDDGSSPFGGAIGHLRIGSGANIAASRLDVVTSSGSFADFDGPAAPLDLAQADIDALRLHVSGAPGTVEIAEAYVEIVYATQPSASALAPTGTVTDTTNPAGEWLQTPGTDGGVQSRYEVKVYSDSEYGAGGFSPDTSEPTFTTGVVLGSAHEVELGPLVDDTYRMYVRTAQTINGQPHWSQWSFIGFTVSVDAPTIASILAIPDDDLARIRLVVTQVTGAEDWETLDVERSDDAGVSWTPVRGATGADPPGDQWIGYDYEAPNGVGVLYRARGNIVTPTTVVGPWLTMTSGVSWSSSSTWIKHPSDTTKNQTVRIAAQPSLTRPARQGVFPVLGRANPVVVSDTRQGVVGTLVVATLTNAQAESLLELLGSTDVLLVQTPAAIGFGSRFVAVGDIVEARTNRTVLYPSRYWELPFVEVDAPADDGVFIAGLAWADLVDAYADWNALIAAFDSWGDLV